ncbi:MAG: branched-chain amino acid ABC transporter permease [Acidimicrobiales bacterium]
MFSTVLAGVWGDALTQAFGPLAVYYAIAAIGLNIHFGYTGLLNFGQVGFMLVGAYGLGFGITTWDLPWFMAIGLGLLLAAVLGVILGLPTLRLRADYLAIVTIASSEIVRLLGRSNVFKDYTGGAEGLSGWSGWFQDHTPWQNTFYSFGPITYTKMQVFVVVFGWLTVALLVLMVHLLMRSPWGRVLKAIREDEDAARALGKNAYSYKMQALLLGGVIGGIAGMFAAVSNGTVQPDFYVPNVTFFTWTILILGGAARVFSPVVGAILFWFMLTIAEGLLRIVEESDALPKSLLSPTDIGDFRYMLMGASLMLLLIFRPQGIFGDRAEMALDDH